MITYTSSSRQGLTHSYILGQNLKYRWDRNDNVGQYNLNSSLLTIISRIEFVNIICPPHIVVLLCKLKIKFVSFKHLNNLDWFSILSDLSFFWPIKQSTDL